MKTIAQCKIISKAKVCMGKSENFKKQFIFQVPDFVLKKNVSSFDNETKTLFDR
jgi:hypothetical protein